MSLLTTIRDLSRGITAQRSREWPAVEHAFRREHPDGCRACGTKSKLEVHHIVPFHKAPDLELDPRNLIVLCRRCHLLIGHLDAWHSHNQDVVEDADTVRAAIRERP